MKTLMLAAAVFSALGSAAAFAEGSSMLVLESSAFKGSGAIPARHTCDGDDVSPALTWSGAPKQTKSFALILEDPDAPVGLWIHWVVYDIPGTAAGLAEGRPKEGRLPDGSKQGKVWGVSAFERVGYWGPCPPPGKPHRYFFRLYALSAPLDLKPQATKADVLRAMHGKVLAEAELVGLYGR